ncbi:MAG: outer membrane protein assembly factor BamA [Betaproteobacteria bacterium]|nr:outer membrane protein assembly factor BamA [Betaproteobacteria bacterium]
MKKRLLFLVLSSLVSLPSQAFEPFQVKDIRVEGIQRTEAGTVFSYLPIKIGDTVNEERVTAAVKALYATGFFKDVRLEADGNILVVLIEERPAIAQVEITGSKEFDAKQLKEGLKQVGLAESRIFDRALLERAERELKNQYIGRGKYGVQITTTVTPLERNRVALNFDISEGEVAKIRQINMVGNKVFKDSDLTSEFVLRTPGWLTWYSKNDQYSKPKLQADLENLRSFYLNQGYLEFTIDSTQVSITPDKRDIFITVNLTEGKKYRVAEIKLAGDLIVPEAELTKLIKLKPGDVFSRERLTETTKLIQDRLGNEGYAFASINPVPEINREKDEVTFTLYIDPGRRVYVRRIGIFGNTNTRDEVVRREMRQLESGWYNTEKLNRSKQRVDKLGYFSDVQVDTPAVPGTTDQVDVEVKLTERATGNLTAGIGYSTAEKVILSAGVSQSNIFGTGNALSFQVSTGSINQIYSLSYTNPYYTDDGVSRGFDVYKRRVDASNLSAIGSYNTSTIGTGVRFGVPITEYDTINYGLAFERTEIGLLATTPQRYFTFVDQFGSVVDNYLGTVGWARDKRDSVIYTTSGTLQRITAEIGMPGGDLTYYRASYQHQWYHPLTRDVVFYTNGQIGYADGYQNKPLPFFKVFYLGGVNSLRGYETASVGPKDTNGDSLGGSRLLLGSAEILFPFPGLQKDKSVRLSWFVDAGTVGEKYDFQAMRYSTGLGFNWYSPVGPLKLSFAKALNPKPDDRLQRIQFSLGTVF